MQNDFYLAMFDMRGRCLRVVKGKNIRELKHMALERCTGNKSMAICDSSETIIWACKGTGASGVPHIWEPGTADSPIGKKVRGVTL